MLSKASFLAASSSQRVLSSSLARRCILLPSSSCEHLGLVDKANHYAPSTIRSIHSAANLVNDDEDDSPSRVQHALLEALLSCSSEPLSSSRRDSIYQELKKLPNATCPPALDFNNDQTALVIPTTAFQTHDANFANLLDQVLGRDDLLDESFWKTFACFYHSPRVVRGNDTVLWPTS